MMNLRWAELTGGSYPLVVVELLFEVFRCNHENSTIRLKYRLKTIINQLKEGDLVVDF